MPAFRASALAQADIREIGSYTIRRWDEAQADKYLGALEAFCNGLAQGRGMERSCDEVSPGLLRARYASHVVFYRRMPYGIRLVRVLHERQLPELHSFEEDEHDEHE